MNELTLCILTMLDLIFCIPFLIIVIAEPSSFSNHETWPLIFLGMGTCGFPISVIGIWQITKLVNKEEEKIK